jgi:SRSO17 transposase
VGLQAAEETGSRFVAIVDGLVSVIGHADRAGPLRDYTGLVMPREHQSLLHFVGEAPWSDERVLAQGRHSVGVARQYCGQLGKQDNCQVAMSLSIANHHASLPVAYQLYLPKD